MVSILHFQLVQLGLAIAVHARIDLLERVRGRARVDKGGPLGFLLVLAHKLNTKGAKANNAAKDAQARELALALGHQTVADRGLDKANDQETNTGNRKNPVKVDGVNPHILDSVAAAADKVVVDLGEEQSTTDTGNGPGSQDNSVQGSDVGGTEHVAQEGGDTTESATVAGSQHPDRGQEGWVVLVIHDGGEGSEDNDLDDQHDDVAGLAANLVRSGGKEETTSQVESTVDRDNGGTSRSGLVKNVDNNGREAGQEHKSGKRVAKEHKVDESVLVGQDGVNQSHGRGGVAHVGGSLLGSEGFNIAVGIDLVAVDIQTVNSKAGRRDTEDQAAAKHDGKVAAAQGDEGVGQTNSSPKRVGNLGQNNGTSSETADSETGGQSTAVREPLLKSRDGRDVAETQTRTSNDSISEVNQSNDLLKYIKKKKNWVNTKRNHRE